MLIERARRISASRRAESLTPARRPAAVASTAEIESGSVVDGIGMNRNYTHMRVYSNILEMVGQTPMLKVKRLDTGPCELFLKLELMNPGGSVKDRIGVSMIEEAERRGDIKPGDLLVEATAGNTGIGLMVLVCVA